MIKDVISSHFKLNELKANDWQSIRCPLHNDSNSSAGIKLDDNMFHCLAGCGAMPLDRLAERLGLDSNNLNDNGKGAEYLEDWFRDLMKIENKPVSIKNQVTHYSNFLMEKKLTHEIITKFGGEYISDQSDKLYGYLKFTYGKKKDRYVARRIIPITTDNEPRFYNSHGNKTLFNQEIISSYNTLVLCEGVTDCLSIYSIGIDNVCASFGAEVSNQQMYLLRGKTVFIIFDKDYAGFEGAKKAAELLKKFDAIPIILELPNYLSHPDDEKIDINSCYVFNSNNLKVWIEEQIRKYSMFDEEYVTGMKSGKTKPSKCWSTGIGELDKVLGGGFITGLHTFGGEPGSGKSTLITEFMDAFAHQGARVLLCDYELPKVQRYARTMSRYSKHPWQEIEKNPTIVEENVYKRLSEMCSLTRIDQDWSIHEIRHAADNFDIIIVDYIQRMFSSEDEKRKRVEANLYGLSNIARYKNKVVLIVSSIPRNVYGTNAGMGIFKESGDIEFVAQSCFKIAKISTDCLKLDILKNTRGEEGGCIFLKPNFPHQKLVSMDITDDMK